MNMLNCVSPQADSRIIRAWKRGSATTRLSLSAPHFDETEEDQAGRMGTEMIEGGFAVIADGVVVTGESEVIDHLSSL